MILRIGKKSFIKKMGGYTTVSCLSKTRVNPPIERLQFQVWMFR